MTIPTVEQDPPLNASDGGNPLVSVAGSETADLSSTDAIPSRSGKCRGIWVDVAGAVKADFADGTTDTLANVAAGLWHPMAITKVYKSGTTATGVHFGY